MVKNILIGLLAACVFFSCQFLKNSFKKDHGPEIVTFEADLGPVTFYHKKHQLLLHDACVMCHHKGSEKTPSCRTCHKKKKDTVEGDPRCFFDVKMSLCRGCHQKERDQETSLKAPIHCSECHDTKKIKWSKRKDRGSHLHMSYFKSPPFFAAGFVLFGGIGDSCNCSVIRQLFCKSMGKSKQKSRR
jgi:hypothetical protein